MRMHILAYKYQLHDIIMPESKNKNLFSIHSEEPTHDVWDRYYNKNDETTNYYQCTNCSVSQEDKKIFVSECSFISVKNSAIRIDNKTLEFLHSFCFFDSCSNNNHQNGGAIYFSCNGSIVQHRFCSVNASVSNWIDGIHSYTDLLEENSSNINYIVESCISYCGYENQLSSIRMSKGISGIFSTNISQNNIHAYSSFFIESPSGCCVINFSTFENNHANRDSCLGYGYGKFHNFLCNIVNNSQENTENGCICNFDSKIIIENCSVLGDYGKGRPFYIEGETSKLIMTNCNLDKLEVSQYNNEGKYKATYNTITNLSKLLYHISTAKCHAINDINNANNQPIQDKLYCPIKIKKDETLLVLFNYPTFCQIIEQLSLCILFETQ